MKLNIKVLIVEDEAIVAANLEQILQQLGYFVVGIAKNAEQALDLLSHKEVDLALLDIKIKGIKDGIWLGDYIQKNHKIPFIYLTAYGNQPTVKKAIATNPSAYLLKPYNKQMIFATIELAISNFNTNTQPKYDDLAQSFTPQHTLSPPESIFIKQKGNYTKIVFKDILFIESNGNYIQVVTAQQQFELRFTLKEFFTYLDINFLQIHRSFVVNLDQICNIVNENIKIGAYTIPIGQSYKEQLLSSINTL